METHQMQIELDGLIKLLAQNLYADPDVFLREMIQNAHDALVKRRAQDKEGALPPPEIRICTDPITQTLTIDDNGAGLKLEEIHQYLATIGRSGTGELKKAMVEQDHLRAYELIGQFGIGLLSAFIVAERIELTTCAEGDSGYRWVSAGGKDYQVEPCVREDVGTTLVLHLASEHLRYLDEDHLTRIVCTYADLIGIPIYINDGLYPVNQVDAPWSRLYGSTEEEGEALEQFLAQRFNGERFLYVWPVEERFCIRDAQGKLREGEVRGVLGITDHQVLGTESAGAVDLYLSQMLIAEKHPGLLPNWARFVRGVIECSQLTPNAARDNVVVDAALRALRQALEKRILRELRCLYDADPARFGEIMKRHSTQILALCTEDKYQTFFEKVAELVPLQTNNGLQTLGEYLQAAEEVGGRKTVHYISDEYSTRQYEMLSQERDLQVVDASYSYVEAFLRRCERTWSQRLRLQRLDADDANGFFAPVDEDEALRYGALLQALGQISGIVPRVSRFKPDGVPALLAEDEGEEERSYLQALAELGDFSPSLRGQVRHLLAAAPLVLHLNANNALVEQLATRGFYTDPVGREAVYALYNNARMLRGHALAPDELKEMFGHYSKLLELLLDTVKAE